MTPLRFELNLSAVRRTRQNFIRKVKVPTLSGGYEIRKVKDHRLVGHYLFRTPERCSGTWSYELTRRLEAQHGPDPVPGRLLISAAPSAARRRAGSSRR